MTIKNAVPKFTAVLFVSIVVAILAVSADGSILARLDSMSAGEYIKSQRRLYHNSFLHHYLFWVLIGCFYIASVEFIAYVISRAFKKPAA